MRIKVRIYKVHDYDLCKIYQINPRQFSKALKGAIIAYYRGLEYTPEIYGEIPDKIPATVREIKIVLDDIEEADVIEGVRRIIPNQRNSFIKNLMRRYLPLTDMCIYDREKAPHLYGNMNKTATLKKKGKKAFPKPMEKENPKSIEEEQSGTKQSKKTVVNELKKQENFFEFDFDNSQIELELPENAELANKKKQEEDDYDVFADFGKLIG